MVAEEMIGHVCPDCGKVRDEQAFQGGHSTCRWCRMIANRAPKRATAAASPLLMTRASPDLTGERRCHFCQETKSVREFTPHPTDRGEYLPYCHTCKPAWNRWRIAHPDQVPQHALEPHMALAVAIPEPAPPAAPEPMVITAHHRDAPPITAATSLHERVIRLRSGGTVTLTLSVANLWDLSPADLCVFGELRDVIERYEAEATA